MTGKRIPIFLGGLVFTMLLTAIDSRADYSVHPGLYTRIEYTDNLFLSESNRNRELIGTVAPGLRYEQDSNWLDLELEYSYEIYRYLNEPDLNEREETHFGRLDGTIRPEQDFRIDLHGDARLESLDRRRSDVVDTPSVNTTNRYLGNVRPSYRFDLGAKNSAEVAYVFETVQYDSTIAEDTESNSFSIAVERNHTDRIDFIIDILFERFVPEDSQTYDRLQGMIGGSWQPFRSTLLTVFGGVARFEYEDGDTFDSRILDCLVRYAPTRRLTLNLSYTEDHTYDITDGLYENRHGEAALSFNGRSTWRIGLVYSETIYLLTARDDTERGIVSELSFQFTPRILARLNGDFRRFEFLPLNENVDRYSAGFSMEYMPRESLALGCRYLYRQNDSDIDINDYRENRASCEVRLMSDLIP